MTATEWTVWQDTSGTVEDRVRRAIASYRRKLGRMPDACYLLQEYINGIQSVDGVELRPKKNAMENYFWMCVDGSKKQDR